MKRFFKKLFKRGDFMTRADKAYYGHKFKTMFWSVFSLFIISWVGTNLVLCALTTNVSSNWDIIYEAEQPTFLPTGRELGGAIQDSTTYEDDTIQTITFDKYNADGKYMVGGVNVVAASTSSTKVNDDVMIYRMNAGKDVYILSNKKMMANPDSAKTFLIFTALVTINFNNFDTSLVEDMSHFFESDMNDVRLVNVNGIENWNTSNVKTMANMFSSRCAIEKLDLSGWDTRNVTDMHSMFGSCSKLTTIYVGENFVVDQVQDSSYMFWYCTKLQGEKGTKCDGVNNIDATYARIDGGPNSATPGYFTAK